MRLSRCCQIIGTKSHYNECVCVYMYILVESFEPNLNTHQEVRNRKTVQEIIMEFILGKSQVTHKIALKCWKWHIVGVLVVARDKCVVVVAIH